MNIIGQPNYNQNIHSQNLINNPSYMQQQQNYNKGFRQQSQNYQDQQQIANLNNNYSHTNKRQQGKQYQSCGSYQNIIEGDDRKIRQKGQSLSQQSKINLFKQQYQYFKSDKYKKLQRIFMEKLHQNLYDKFSQSQNYYFTRDLNDLLQGSRTKFTIKFRDLQVYDEKEEYLKRMYAFHEYPQKIKLLTEYYKFHQDIPRLFMQPVCNIINHMHDKKRRIEFYRIAKIIEEENKKNPNKPPKGIVGDIPAPGTEESVQDKNSKGKSKPEKGLSNFLKDLSSFVNIGSGDSKTNIDNLTKSQIINKNIAKYSSQGSKTISNGIVQSSNQQKQHPSHSSGTGKHQDGEGKGLVNANQSSVSMQQSQKGIQDTLLEINFKLNDILQQSTMSVKSDVTINDMVDNHGLEDFLKFLSKDQNINLMSRTSRNSINQNKQVGTHSINLQTNDIKLGQQNSKKDLASNQSQNIINGGTINLQTIDLKNDSNRTTRSSDGKEGYLNDKILEQKYMDSFKQNQSQQNNFIIQNNNIIHQNILIQNNNLVKSSNNQLMQGNVIQQNNLIMQENQAYDQNSYLEGKKQLTSENNSNSTKTSQQNLDKVYNSSKTQFIIQQKINEQLQLQQNIDEPSKIQKKNLKISISNQAHSNSATVTTINSTKNQQNNQIDLKLNLNSIQNHISSGNNTQQNTNKMSFQQSKRLSTGGAINSESQKTLLSHRINKPEIQIDDYPLTSRASLNSGGIGGNLDNYSSEFTASLKPIANMRGQINSQQLNINVNLSQQPNSNQNNFSTKNQILSDSLTTKSGSGIPYNSDSKISSQPIFQQTFSGDMHINNSQQLQSQNSGQLQSSGSQLLIQNNGSINSHSLTQSQFKISKAKKSTNNPSTIPSQKALDGASPRGDSCEDPDFIYQNKGQQNSGQPRISKVKNQSHSSRNQFSSIHAKPLSQLNSPQNSLRSFNMNINTSGGFDTMPGSTTSQSGSNNFQNILNQNTPSNNQIDNISNRLSPSSQQKIMNQIQNIDNLQKQFQLPTSTKGNAQNSNTLQQQQQQLQAKFLASQNTQKLKTTGNTRSNEGLVLGNLLSDGLSGQQTGKSGQQSTATFTQKSAISRESNIGLGVKSSHNIQLNANQNILGSQTQRAPTQQAHFRQHSNPVLNNLLVSPSSLFNPQSTTNAGSQNIVFSTSSSGFNYFSRPANNGNQIPVNNIANQSKLQNNNNNEQGNPQLQQNTNKPYPIQNEEYFQRNNSIINVPSTQGTAQILYKEGPLISPRMDSQKQFFGAQQNTNTNNQQQSKKLTHKYTKSDQQQNNYNYLQQYQIQQSAVTSPQANQSSKMIKVNINPNQQLPIQISNQATTPNQGNNPIQAFNFKSFDQSALSSQANGNNPYSQTSKQTSTRQIVSKLSAQSQLNTQLGQNGALGLNSGQIASIGQNTQSIKIKSVSPRKQIAVNINSDQKKYGFQ